MIKNCDSIVIIGAGPAGLSAAYSLLSNNKNIKLIIIEAEDDIGGISRTYYNDFGGTDVGPHRFFTKNQRVMDLWTELLPVQGFPSKDDLFLNRDKKYDQNGLNPEKNDRVLLKRRRFSRIYYQKHFFDYPIKLSLSTISSMGLIKTFCAGLSYLKSCLFKVEEKNLEDFMINRFGRVLYNTFFKDYTEKVWGLPPSKISKEWGVQRIKGISLKKVLLNAISGHSKEVSMIDEYYYPKFGSSQMWNLMSEKIKALGGEIVLNSQVIKINSEGKKIVSVSVKNSQSGEIKEINCGALISSMPVKELVSQMNDVPSEIMNIAQNLVYRDFILVNFVSEKFNLKNNTDFATVNNIAPDSWIYLQDENIKAGRLDIMNNFSPYMIKDYQKDVIFNLEYFCNETDDFWKKNDSEIIDFAVSELLIHNIVKKEDIKSSRVIRIKKAYPSYFGSYSEFSKVQNYLNTFDNLYCIGRNGQHKYNNMDHSILSGLVVSDIISNNGNKNQLWEVNTDDKYQEVK